MSSGTEDEVTSTRDLIHTIVKPDEEITDADHNGSVTWQERFGQSLINDWGATSTFLAGDEYADTGIDGTRAEPPHFSTSLRRVSTADDYEKEMENLRPGDFAVVAVDPSADYAQKLESLAKKTGGRALFIAVSGMSAEDSQKVDLPPGQAVYVVDFRGLKAAVENTADPLSERPKIYDDIVSQRAYWADGMSVHPDLTKGRLPEKYAQDPYFRLDVERRVRRYWARKIEKDPQLKWDAMPLWLLEDQTFIARYRDAIKRYWLRLNQDEPRWAWENMPTWLQGDQEIEATYRDAMRQRWEKAVPPFRVHLLDLSLVRFWNIGAPDHSISSTGVGGSLGFSLSPLRTGTESLSTLGIYVGGVAAISGDGSESSSGREEISFQYAAAKLGIPGETTISDHLLFGAMPYVSGTHVSMERNDFTAGNEKINSERIYSGSAVAWGIDLSLRYFLPREVSSYNLAIGYERIGSLRDGGNMLRVSIGPHLSF